MTTSKNIQNKWFNLLILLGFITLSALYLNECNKTNELKKEVIQQKKRINAYKDVCMDASMLLDNYCKLDIKELKDLQYTTVHKIDSLFILSLQNK